MINIYKEERSCQYKGEEYLVRDNGAVLRKARKNKPLRKNDEVWTFGKTNAKTGYLEISSERVHRIVATAFYGLPPTEQHVVDHIDTNRQNNRPSNLRWVTKLENVMLNPITRAKIEYITGVNVEDFLENPSQYRDCFGDAEFGWMRQVTEEEAKNCLENLTAWAQKEKGSPYKNSTRKMGEEIFGAKRAQERTIFYQFNYDDAIEELMNGASTDTDSLTPMAKQRDWKTPTKFCCCPSEIDGDPIECYLKNIEKDKVFSSNQYGDSFVEDYVKTKDNEILVITEKDYIKPWGLLKIVFENGYYVHESLGMFFTDDGAYKQFTLEQGLEWTGPESIDDHC